MMRKADWIGGVGESWASEWRRTDRSFAGLDPALERAILAAPTTGGRWVDLGCGAGRTSIAVAEARPDVDVVGIDLSPDLIAVAADRAGYGGERGRCRFVVGDAVEQVAGLAPVDYFFSRHGVMFFDDPVAAFGRLAAAAAPGARLTFSCFAAPRLNPWAGETLGAVAPGGAAQPAPATADVPPPGPFAFAEPARVDAILAGAGWVATAPPETAAFRYVAGGDDDPVDDALSFFQRIGPAAAALRALPDADRPAALDRLADTCRRHRDGGEVAFPAAAWLWSARLKETAR